MVGEGRQSHQIPHESPARITERNKTSLSKKPVCGACAEQSQDLSDGYDFPD
jgi:hypothetical protein